MEQQNSVVSPQADVSRIAPTRRPDREVVYKKIAQPNGGGDLQLHVYLPPNWKATDQRPAIVFFFGGGWRIYNPQQFYAKAEYLASRGMVAFCADYRVLTRHQTTFDSAMEDARSALRCVRAQGRQWGVDGEKIVAAGGSSGGHLAAACALLDGPDDSADDCKISCQPQALVLFNPVLDLIAASRKGGHLTEVILIACPGDSDQAKKAALKKLSPFEYLRKNCPPTVMLFGADDAWLPDAKVFAAKSRQLGNRVDTWIAPNMPHGFFNAAPWHQETLIKTDAFLASLGFLSGPPTIPSADPSAVLASYGENAK
jgi:acetyl esterase/lipase